MLKNRTFLKDLKILKNVFKILVGKKYTNFQIFNVF